MSRLFFPPPNCLCFFATQLRSVLRFLVPLFCFKIAHIFQVPLNQLVSNSFKVLVGFFMVLRFYGYPVTAHVFVMCIVLRSWKRGFSILFLIPVYPSCISPMLQSIGKSAILCPPSPCLVFPKVMIHEAHPPARVGTRTEALSSLLEKLNASRYDCRSLIDERLLGHFGLAPVTEPLGDSLENIMFSKLMRDHMLGGRSGGTPTHKSSKGPLLLVAPRGALPRNLGQRHLLLSPPPCFLLLLSLERRWTLFLDLPSILARAGQRKSLLGSKLEEGVLSSGDRQLLSPISQEELEGMGVLYIFKATSVYEEFSSRPQGIPPISSSDAQMGKLEDRLERLGNENAKLREVKKEVTGRCQQLEREVRQLKKKAIGYEGALKRAVEKAMMDFPHFEEGKNFLEAYWESHLKEFKGSIEYQ
ncbi:UNVERIFIED_CONTAM: hypothetical protein Sindi_1651600 [Sesamum indicum]